MPAIYWVLIVALATIALFDASGSILSRRFQFKYERLAIVSFLIYAVSGFAGARAGGQQAGIIVAACAGFFDVTIGWKISIALKANINNNPISWPSTSKWIAAAIMVTLSAAILGFAASELAKVIGNI